MQKKTVKIAAILDEFIVEQRLRDGVPAVDLRQKEECEKNLVATLLAGFKEISSSAGNADDIWNSRNRKGWAYFADSMLDAEMGVSSACRKPIVSLGTCGIARVCAGEWMHARVSRPTRE